MKRVGLLILFILLLGNTISFAQLITYKKQMIYIDEKPYAYLFKKGSIWAKDFSFQSLKNEAVMEAKPILKEMDGGYEFVYYEISFKGTDKKAEIEDSKNFDLRLAHELGIFEVLVNDEINPAGILKFIAKYPNTISKKIENGSGKSETVKPSDTKPEVIAKEEELKKLSMDQAVASSVNMPVASFKVPEGKIANLPAPVAAKTPAVTKIAMVPGLKINGSAILKGAQKLGKFTVSEQFVNDKPKRTYGFYNAKNIKIATATFTDPKTGICKIYSFKDKKTRTITTATDGQNLKVLTSWLVQNRYL
jgi:hypothetical protein